MQREEERDLYEQFAENIKQRRKELGLSQRDMAARLGIAQPGYALIETGKREPGLRLVERIAQALETTPTKLIEENSAVIA